MKRIAMVLAMMLSVSGLAAPAFANDARFVTPFANDPRSVGSPPSSVFPVPRDPWRSWGVRPDVPQQRIGPRSRGDVFAEREPMWVPGQWVWDGASWVWWPGYWVR
jgi:hypothetical protein